MSEAKSYFITEADILMALEYVKANQPCKSNDVAAHIGRTKNSTRQMLNRDSRFKAEILDNSNVLYWPAPEYGPYDIPLPCGIIHHHGAGSSKGKAHQPLINELCLFALQPWLVRRVEDERFNIGLQSPRLYAAD